MVSLSLSSGFQSSGQRWVVCMSVYDGGESFSPGMLPASQPEPAAESAQREVASRQCSEAGHCQFGGCSPQPPPQTVTLIKSENHIRTKFRVKTSKSRSRMEGWRGWGSSCFSVLKKKNPEANWKKKNNNLNSKLEIRGSCMIINPVFRVARVIEMKKWPHGPSYWTSKW